MPRPKPLWKRKNLTPTLIMAAKTHKAAGQTVHWIADELRISEEMVKRALTINKVEISQATADIKQAIADKFMQKASDALDNITSEKLQESSSRDLAVTAGILHQHARLAEGKSTSNALSLSVIVEKAARIREGKLKEFENEPSEKERLLDEKEQAQFEKAIEISKMTKTEIDVDELDNDEEVKNA